MISIEQIKAARALLEWTQDNLAKASGLSLPAINNLERRIALPRVETLRAVQTAFEQAGIEFTEGPGVRLRGDSIKTHVFEGKESIFRLWNDMLETLPKGGERLLNGIDERMFDALAGKKRFREMMKKFAGRNIVSRILVREGESYFVEPRSHYRWVPEVHFSTIPHFVYANKYAILLAKPVQRVLLIENAGIAESFRAQFNKVWAKAGTP
jgi:transcriptional regulator with XRE-family HTH domain